MASLIGQGYDANYSTALNHTLLASIVEGASEGGYFEETRNTLQSFLIGKEVLQSLSLREGLANLREFWGWTLDQG